MTDRIIHGLSNEDYHNSEPYRQYLSSSQLKHYLRSPKAAKYTLDHPDTSKSDALRFGSLFHMAMELFQKHGTIDAFYDNVLIFRPPINEKTGKPYGSTTKVYAEAFARFLSDKGDKEIVTPEEAGLIEDMVGSLTNPSIGGATAVQVLKLLKWGKPEVSYFYETKDGIKLKVRPDLITRRKIVDWKTVATDDLSEDSINRIILKYGYHISAAMYQWVLHEITGKWYDFILVLVSKTEPYDCVMVDMGGYGYRYTEEYDLVSPGPGAMEFGRLLELHTTCVKNNHWPGAETFIPDNNGVRVLEIQPPRYYANRFIEET
ncbi:MAG: PD-(D/E)XK nuclease-like domain-containing protein [Muribaculaceae bacterium]|nr:PD-(D/E)XK nuclease-like domain-containing protein [Muribaculaceae bacterium]